MLRTNVGVISFTPVTLAIRSYSLRRRWCCTVAGEEVLRITAGTDSSSAVCIWTLAVLPDGTIVSGDSDGATQFWEGRYGTLINRFQQHSGDVLSISCAPDGRTIFSSGVDPRVSVWGGGVLGGGQ